MFPNWGRSRSSILSTGPIMAKLHWGRRRAASSRRARSMRSSITPKKPMRGWGRPSRSSGTGGGGGGGGGVGQAVEIVGHRRGRVERLAKVVGLDAAGEGVDVAVNARLGLAQAHSAGE